jgi:hypothetical protein
MILHECKQFDVRAQYSTYGSEKALYFPDKRVHLYLDGTDVVCCYTIPIRTLADQMESHEGFRIDLNDPHSVETLFQTIKDFRHPVFSPPLPESKIDSDAEL